MEEKKITWQKKIYNMDKSTKVKLIIVMFGIILIGIVMLKSITFGCVVKEYILLEQELKFDEKCKNFQCLFIKTKNLETGEVAVSYFESDRYLLNNTFGINVGDKMKMQWCEIKGVGMRVRGITKS